MPTARDIPRLRPAPRLVSVVMPVYNSARTLPAQLDALAVQDYDRPWELVLADNGSTDGGAELARRWSERIPLLRVVDASDRRGATHARNAGIAASRGDFIALCDADDVATPGWLTALAHAARRADLIAGRLDDDPLNPLDRRWRGSHRDRLGVSLGFLPYAVSANMGAWTSVFGELGGWCEDFPHGGDDVDFSWRAQLAGYEIDFASDAVVDYRYRDTIRSHARQSFNYGRADVLLYQRFREAGVSHDRLASAARRLTWLVTRLPFLAMSRRRRGFWVGYAAVSWGRLRGGLEQRVFFA